MTKFFRMLWGALRCKAHSLRHLHQQARIRIGWRIHYIYCYSCGREFYRSVPFHIFGHSWAMFDKSKDAQ